MDFSIDLAKSLIDSPEEFPVDFDLAWNWVGYTRKDSAKEKLIRNFEKDVDYSAKWRSVAHGNGSSASRTEQIFLTVDAFKAFGMMAGTAKGKEIRKYFLECEKVAKQAIAQPHSKLHLAPFWYQRLTLFLAQNKVPPGYFSIFQETIILVGDLESAGYIIPDNAVPDISIGLCWAKHLRGEGIEPNEVAVTYPHKYPDHRNIVNANAYPEDMLPKFRKWFRETYKTVKLPAYLAGKDSAALPALSKMLGIPIAQLKGN